MNILLKTKKFYDEIGLDMYRDISAYMASGYVYASPEMLIMGKPVCINGGDPDKQINPVAPDAWYVKLAVGESHISDFINLMPYPLPWVGWRRELKNKPIRWWSLEKIKRRN